MMQKCTQIASHLLYYAIFLLVFTNLGFFGGVTISQWHIPLSLILYIFLLLAIRTQRHLPITFRGVLLVLFIPLIFLVTGWVFVRTFDTSYDGQLYHQTAVISLSNGWNPIWDRTLPIIAPTGQYGEDGEFGKPFVIGYPKSLWSIQSAIHLLSGKIQVATLTNLTAGVIAFIFLLSFLLELSIPLFLAVIVSLLAVLEPHFVIEFTSFMQDGVSYQLAIIAMVSLLAFMMKNQPSALLVFGSAWLLLAGAKFSSLPIIATLAGIAAGYLIISGQWLEKPVYRRLGLLAGAGIIILTSPYIINVIRYGSPVYPGNLDWAKEDVKYQNSPINLRGKSGTELLFYGIFAKPQISTAADNPANIAQLKIPFTFSQDDLTQVQSERVGTSGIFFSGLIILSVVFLAANLLQKQSAENYHVLIIIVAITLCILLCALALPVPNVIRFTPQICFIPIMTLIGMIKVNKEKQLRSGKILTALFSVLIAVNILSILVPIVTIRLAEFKRMSEQLQAMRNSGDTYHVYAQNFYSSYLRLQENKIKFMAVAEVGCEQPGVLERTFSTSFCPPIK